MYGYHCTISNGGIDNVSDYFDRNNGDIGNGLAAVGYVLGAVGNWAGNIIKSRSLYGAPNATTVLRTSMANIHVSTSSLKTAGKVLTGLGAAAGTAGVLITGYQYAHNQITGTEAVMDAAFGVIGFFGPFGAGISIIYFGGKAIYEYSSGETLFYKPK